MNLSGKYDAFYRNNVPENWVLDFDMKRWPHNRVEAILTDTPNGSSVLDVGCGDGYLLYLLKDRYESLIGLEYSNTRLDHAKLNLAGLNFTGICGSAENMEAVADESIDVIVSADTIEHIPDVYPAMSELYRVLKPSGLMIMNTPNIAFIKRRLQLLLGRFPSTSQDNEGLGSDVLFDGGHLHYFTYRSLKLLMERAGFSVLRKRGYGKLGRLHGYFSDLTSMGVQLIAQKPG